MGIRLKDLPKDVQKRILANQPPQKKRSKFRNVPTELDGHTFSSKLEASVWSLLRIEERPFLEPQVSVPLVAGITCVADFRYFDLDRRCPMLCEAKGRETAVYRLKLRLYKEFGTMPLRVFKGTHENPTEVEVIIPKGVSSKDLR